MYRVSEAFREALLRPTKVYHYSGSITCTDGTVYNFAQKDISNRSKGTLTRRVSDGTGLELGSTCAAELDLALFLSEVDRYQLYDAVIELFYTLNIGEIWTWGDAASFTWADLASSKWGDYPKAITGSVPLGVFTISEINRTVNELQIKAYDNMLKFDKSFKADDKSRAPFDWLLLFCKDCGVPLGMSRQEVRALTNGQQSFACAADVVEDCDTYRSALSYLAAALCCVAQIDRSGALVLRSFNTTPVLTFSPSLRYSSQLSDFQTYYTGLYATYKEGGLSEYYHTFGPDNGLVYNLGVNPFLQISKDNTRKKAVQAIIYQLGQFRYTPFSSTIPGDPSLDPMDVISFSGNQATAQDFGAITEITYRINDKMDIACAGDNPRLNQAKSRYTKNIEGLLSGSTYSGGSAGNTDFWMVYDDNSDGDQEIDSEPTVVCSLDLDLSADHTKSQVNFTATYTLDEDAIVTADVQVDGSSIYLVTDKQIAGPHTLTVTCGKAWDGRRKHEVTIYLSEEVVANESAPVNE